MSSEMNKALAAIINARIDKEIAATVESVMLDYDLKHEMGKLLIEKLNGESLPPEVKKFLTDLVRLYFKEGVKIGISTHIMRNMNGLADLFKL